MTKERVYPYFLGGKEMRYKTKRYWSLMLPNQHSVSFDKFK